MSPSRLRLLLLAYHFPPEISGGAGRPDAMCRELPRHGIDVDVVTTTAFGRVAGESRVLRVGSLANVTLRASPWKLPLKALQLAARRCGFEDLRDPYWRRGVEGRLRARGGLESYDAVYATYPPVDTLIVGRRLARRAGIPLIVELRDGLTFEGLRPPHPVRDRRIARLERSAVEAAAGLVTIGNRLSDGYRKTYPGRRVETVFNGWSEEDAARARRELRAPDQVFRIAHFGSIGVSRQRSADALWDALVRLEAEGQVGGSFEVAFVGRATSAERQAVQRRGLEGTVRFLDPMPKPEGLCWLRRHADALLFYGSPGEPTVISAKLMDYLGLDLPVVGVCAGNEAAEILQRTAAGLVCDFEATAIAEAIRRVWSGAWAYAPDRERVAEYGVSRQMKRLAELIAELVPSPRARLA